MLGGQGLECMAGETTLRYEGGAGGVGVGDGWEILGPLLNDHRLQAPPQTFRAYRSTIVCNVCSQKQPKLEVEIPLPPPPPLFPQCPPPPLVGGVATVAGSASVEECDVNQSQARSGLDRRCSRGRVRWKNCPGGCLGGLLGSLWCANIQRYAGYLFQVVYRVFSNMQGI